jgi:hypothetical protein
MAAPIDVVIKGQALNSFGLTANDTISGVGLNTFGFLWPCADIWYPADENVTTTWSECTLDSGSTEIETCLD